MATTLSSDVLQAALELAVRAPSIHNPQPWRFRIQAGTVHVYADPTRRLTATDLDGHDLMVSCGALLHHLRIAFAALGNLAVTDYLPDPTDPNHLATITTIPRPATHDALTLAVSIPRRRSDRRRYRPQPLTPATLDELTARPPPTPPNSTSSAPAPPAVRSCPPWPKPTPSSAQTPPTPTSSPAGPATAPPTTASPTPTPLPPQPSAISHSATREGLATCPLTQPLEIPTIRALLRPRKP